MTLSYRRLCEWRQGHRHDISEEAEQPTVIESTSSHERSWVIGEELRA